MKCGKEKGMKCGEEKGMKCGKEKGRWEVYPPLRPLPVPPYDSGILCVCDWWENSGAVLSTGNGIILEDDKWKKVIFGVKM